MTSPSADLFLPASAQLGEGPIWDAARRRLLFADIMRGHVHVVDVATGADRIIEIGQPVGAIALAARGDWIVAAKRGFYRVDPDSGRVTTLAEVEADIDHNRMNDGYVDARGRFWAGTMDMEGGTRGALYRLDPDGRVHQMLTGVGISNGIDWSPDGRLMYYVDTPTRRIDVFDFDEERGEISGRRPFVVIAPELGHPDGMIVDAAGFVWQALWGGGAVHRYAPDGRLDRVVKLPPSQVTKCAFGGADLGDLYITTAWIELADEERARQPQAGHLFRFRPGVFGRAPNRFGG